MIVAVSVAGSKKHDVGSRKARRSLAGIALLLLLALPVTPSSRAAEPTEGTKKMTARLQAWGKAFGDRNPYNNLSLVRSLEERLTQQLPPSEWLSIQAALISQYTTIGQPEKALVLITNLFQGANARGVAIGPKDRRNIRLQEGLAYLRLGELENCIGHHNPDSCLLPIRGGGEHAHRRGSENAFEVFEDLARQRPSDLGIRWLLNVTAMTLGRYPGGVPAAHRIPESVFKSDAQVARFREIGTQLGFDQSGLAGGAVAEDFDGDGFIDIFLTDWEPLTQCQLWRNLGDGRFENITDKALLTGVTGGLNAMQTDYNNDGRPDLYIVRGAWMGELGLLPNSLLKNNGDGTFTDVTEDAGLLEFSPALSATWFDANNDGWLDLYLGRESQNSGPSHPCPLYINNGDGTFTDRAQEAGVNLTAFVRGVTAGDFDNDGWTDLYLSCLGRTNVLYRNVGREATNTPARVRFEEITISSGVGEPVLSFPTWFWDYDNDGWLDLWVSGYGADARAFFDPNVGHFTLGEIVAMKLGRPSKAETPRLYQNRRNGTFANVTRETGLRQPLLTMGCNFGDLDTDGFLDFYVGTGSPYFGSLLPNEMYRNEAGKRFQNVTTAGGFGHLQKGHGVAFADLNEDGHQEVIANMGGAYGGDTFFDALFANPGNSNRWIKLQLVGTRSNKSAVGARLKVVTKLGNTRSEIHRVVGSGGSFGASPFRQEIGLGNAGSIEHVEVWWPASGTTNRFSGLLPNHRYRITEGGNTAEKLPATPPFALPGPSR